MTLYTYLSSFNNYGKPVNLNTSRTDGSDIKEAISQAFIDEVNTNLAEQNKVTNTHPDWIKKSDLYTMEECELSVTFVHEGAGYKNVLAYYVYDKLNPPTRFSDVEEIIIVFPNASLNGSGGQLEKGDTVQIPYSVDSVTTDNRNRRIMSTATWLFPADVGVSWVCMSDRWRYNGSSYATVATGHMMYSSDPILNPESTLTKRNHCVNYRSEVDDTKIVNGFEDIHRDKSWCDHDFNDLVFYATATPPTAIDPVCYNSTTQQTFKGTILCEDQWNKNAVPGGNNDIDNDYNDLSLYYNIVETLSETKIKNLCFKLEVFSRGATYDHDFGIVIPNIKNTNAKIYRETYTSSTNTTTLTNITNNIIGKTNNVPIISDTKVFFPDTSVWATNTISGTDIIEPSWVKLRIVFPGDGVERSELDDISFPYNFYLKSWFIQESQVKTRHILYSKNLYSDVPSSSSSLGIVNRPKILILENVTEFRVPIEKQRVSYVYHKYNSYLAGNNKFLAWYLPRYARENLLYPLVDAEDTHSWNNMMDYTKNPSEKHYFTVPLEFGSSSYEWNDTEIQEELSNHGFNTTDILDWDDIDTSSRINEVVNMITNFGPHHVIKSGLYKTGENKNFYVSITSLQTNPNRTVHATHVGTNETLELLSMEIGSTMYPRCITSV